MSAVRLLLLDIYGNISEVANVTKPDENCEHCRVMDIEVPEKLNIFSGKMKESTQESVSLNLQGRC